MHSASSPDAIIKKYFSSELDSGAEKSGETAPRQQTLSEVQSNIVKAYIDGTAYFEALDDEITALINSSAQDRYFYMTAWWLGLLDVSGHIPVVPFGPTVGVLAKNFPKVGEQWSIQVVRTGIKLPKSKKTLLSRLVDLHAAGVDVRVLAWTSPFAPKYELVGKTAGGITTLNIQTLLSVAELRKKFGSGHEGRIMLNTMAHPLGAAHLKTVVCGDFTKTCAYVGGLDPAPGRQEAGWHDVAVKVQGPAAQAVHSFFGQLWTEQSGQPVEAFHVNNLEIPSRFSSAPKFVPIKPIAVRKDTGQCVQVLRTVPQMNFTSSGPTWLYPENSLMRFLMTQATGFQRKPLSFAPHGTFEFKVALRKAISKAERYVFIADQAFSSQDVMDWLHIRLGEVPDLKVILLHGGDPEDPPTGDMSEAVNNHLLKGLKPDPVKVGEFPNVVCYGWEGTVVHAKTVIIDDLWCAVGSANCMRRSLFTDIELSIAMIDPNPKSVVHKLRRDLWAKYCGLTLEEDRLDLYQAEREELNDLDRALGLWKPTWLKGAPPTAKLQAEIKPYVLPVPAGAPYSEDDHNRFDADSRKKF
ncbi:hypothetical protein DPM19_09365 [Actinomadura craniellae]|uniref:PLD phosphodiesterase domain-containing protein n=1 Tax=Actinomadura craniellae TaxID=2231787 RepID=A0A365HA24_9ACTN|nr:phospholipase D-like domain-containing protein [Actinomadura craniellae]RAY15947.1 hypothetical protein DPM19_09365 [Actinomadura craniellae]